ncbi:MAG: flagellin N-terminal helical domain-containing protein [Steroidobacteraceae bacterium]
MSLVLNTNLDALIAQNSLTTSGNQLTTALQQLSSGLQINSAANNAAGYAIAQGMTSQINGLNTAINNTNDGVSLTQTAQGSLQQITNDLQTMRNLAVQSLNATNSAQDRQDLNQQFQQLAADINQVAQTASFNGVNLLDGSFQGATFQVGANVGQSITVSSVASASTSAIGNYYNGAAPTGPVSVQTASGSTLYATAATAGAYSASTLAGSTGLNTAVPGSSVTLNVTVNGKNYTTNAISLTGNASTDLQSVAASINQALSSAGGLAATVNSAGTGIQISGTAAAGTGSVVSFSVASATNASGTSVTANSATLQSLGVDSTDIVGAYATGATAPSDTGTLPTTLPSASTAGSFSLKVGGALYTTGSFKIGSTTSTDYANIANALNATSAFVDAGLTATVAGGSTPSGLTITGQSGSVSVTSGIFTTTSSTAYSMTFASPVTASTGHTPTASSSVQYLSGLNVNTVGNSNLTLLSIDNALQQIATTGAQLGAYQNRFQAAVTGLQTDSQNLSAAKSQIVDTNYAQATSSLSKAQILQQAGTAMVAQANIIPQNILTLLQKLP